MVPSIFEASGGPFSDYVAFQFRRGGDDGEHRAAHGGGGFQSLLNVKGSQFPGRGIPQAPAQACFDAAGKTVKSPDHNDIKHAATRIGHQCIQTGSHFLGAAEPSE
jgi:hypothetical protein